MIYGATGYTGRLVARDAREQGLSPILAGRSNETAALASELGLPARVFSLSDVAATRRALDGMTVVAHCAGPFAVDERADDRRVPPRAHALRRHHRRNRRLRRRAAPAQRGGQAAGIVVCPGVGFDVIPTDCVGGVPRRGAARRDASRARLSRGRRAQPRNRAHVDRRHAARCARAQERRDRHRAARTAYAHDRLRDRGKARGVDSVGRRRHRVLHDRHREHRGVRARLAPIHRAAAPTRSSAAAAAPADRARTRRRHGGTAQSRAVVKRSATRKRPGSGAKCATTTATRASRVSRLPTAIASPPTAC